MKATRKLALILGVALLATSVVAPVEAAKNKPTKQKKRPKEVSQEVSWKQAMQKPRAFEKTDRKGLGNLNRLEVVQILPNNRKDQAMADFRVTAYTSLGTDAFTFRYMSEIAMVSANAIWEEVPARRGKIVWTPFGRAYKWTALLHDYAMRKPPKDWSDFGFGTGIFQWHRYQKFVEGKEVPALSVWTIGASFSTYARALRWYPNLTKQMGF